MVKRLLSMREVSGSILGDSNYFYFHKHFQIEQKYDSKFEEVLANQENLHLIERIHY